jgi:hypothetical protein
MTTKVNRLVLIGNGFDLAHGLKTSYKNFIDWYMCKAFEIFCKQNSYEDPLIKIKQNYIGSTLTWETIPKTFEEVLDRISSNKTYVSYDFPSMFFKKLVASFTENTWVDVERFYFRLLKSYFSNPNLVEKKEVVQKLNKDFNFLISQLVDYIKVISDEINITPEIRVGNLKYDLYKAFERTDRSQVKFLNFNYTETIFKKGYADEENIIHIHGRVADINNNPLIFGYGDETDPVYQNIEDSGENIYLKHIKSFGYFRAGNYQKLLSYIDSAPYIVYIVGHSCDLSDRVLLNEIFENRNCKKIEIFYHQRKNGSNNFKEITQEISRHFRPQNKGLMRRKIVDWSDKNIIPQNT